MTPPDHIGKYVDLNLVGFGTYGSVYRAWDPDLDRYVAIKVMNARFSQDEGSLARFQDLKQGLWPGSTNIQMWSGS